MRSLFYSEKRKIYAETCCSSVQISTCIITTLALISHRNTTYQGAGGPGGPRGKVLGRTGSKKVETGTGNQTNQKEDLKATARSL